MGKKVFWAFLFLVSFSSSVSAQVDRDAVIKLFVTANAMDYYRPWQSHGSGTRTGSGAVIQGNLILTNAHVVSDHTFIQVRKNSDPKKYIAKVVAIGDDCDLAVLTVEDKAFFEGIKPFKLGGLPKISDTVIVLGYPQGGDKLSVTEGVVSRVEITNYVQSSKKLLAVQIDAAINPGNSGGPVIQDEKLVGIAMQGITQSQNIGYMIPVPIIDHFFTDLKDEVYDGFPALGINIGNTENDALRKYFSIESVDGGVLVTDVEPRTAAETILRKGDILLSLDDIDIGVDGTFAFRDAERLTLSYIISSKQVGEKIKVDFVRDGQENTVSIPLKIYKPLVPPLRHYEKPSYFIYGGFVFTVLSSDLLRSWGRKWWEKAPVDFLYHIIGEGRYNDANKDEVVVLLQVLPDDVNIGYHAHNNEVVTHVNGQEIGSFQDFVQRLNENQDDYVIIETAQKSKFVLDAKEAGKKTPEIISRNNIPFQYSDDVKEWLGE